MCAAFIEWAQLQGWTSYAETAGWDTLLVRDDGYQLGVQAKQTLNLDVVVQSIEGRWASEAPDFRAVLAPRSTKTGLIRTICRHLDVTVIEAAAPGPMDERGYIADAGRRDAFFPRLPVADEHGYWRDDWFETCPDQRCALPEYVPDVVAGSSSPISLTKWKVGAIKIAVILEERGTLCRADFKHIGIDPSRWFANWLSKTPEGWVANRYMPDFKAQHPVNFEQIRADAAKWMPPPPAPKQPALDLSNA